MDKRKFSLCLIDIAFLAVSYLGLYLFAENFNNLTFGENGILRFALSLLACVVINLVFRSAFKVYSNIWRYATSGIYLRLILADFCTGVAMLFVDILSLLPNFHQLLVQNINI